MKTIKITSKMAADFKSKRENSNGPEFKISDCGEITHGCKVIEITEKAVFVHVSAFLWCGGFWMPKATYATLKNGYISSGSNLSYAESDTPTLIKGKLHNKLNYNNTIYQY